jgi:hypothetical protein
MTRLITGAMLDVFRHVPLSPKSYRAQGDTLYSDILGERSRLPRPTVHAAKYSCVFHLELVKKIHICRAEVAGAVCAPIDARHAAETSLWSSMRESSTGWSAHA